MSTIQKQTLVVAGLEVNVFSRSQASLKDVAVFFLLHGRQQSADEVESIARAVVQKANAGAAEKQGHTVWHELLVITFDQRNHGKRLVDPKADNSWSTDTVKNNECHAVDMYAIQTGTARDVSSLVDILPAFLFPEDAADPVAEWGVIGIGLGGHAAWLALTHDIRIGTAIPIIACPDHLRLMEERAAQVGRTGESVPTGLRRVVMQLDPPYAAGGVYEGKRVLVLAGKADTVVPWEACRAFVENLQVGAKGIKRWNVYPGVGHVCTEVMIEKMAGFIAEFCL